MPRLFLLLCLLIVIAVGCEPVSAPPPASSPASPPAASKQDLRFEMFKDTNKEWRWRLIAANNKIIGIAGESFKNRGDCEGSIQLVREAGSRATAGYKLAE